jgi:hypothetical protein
MRQRQGRIEQVLGMARELGGFSKRFRRPITRCTIYDQYAKPVALDRTTSAYTALLDTGSRLVEAAKDGRPDQKES